MFFTLRVTLTDTTVIDLPAKYTFDDARETIEEMYQKGHFTDNTLSPVTFIPWLRVAKIELIVA